VIARGIESVESHRTGRRSQETQEGFDGRCLTRAVRSEQRTDLAVIDLKGDIVNGVQVTEGDS
jgi:hypothetical protein